MTVQKLLAPELGRLLANTNLMENCFAQAARRTRRVKRWEGPHMNPALDGRRAALG